MISVDKELLLNDIGGELDELSFSEEIDGNESSKEALPPLGYIGAQHTASMLAGGATGNFAKEITLDGVPSLIKAANVRKEYERKVIKNGVAVKEVVSEYEQMFSNYNLITKELEVYL
jgi:hypothetical protein